MQARTAALGGVAFAVCALGGYLVYQAMASPAPSASAGPVAPVTTTADVRPASPATRSAPVGLAASPNQNDDGDENTADDAPAQATQGATKHAFLEIGVGRELMSAAAGCYDGTATKDEYVELEFRLRVQSEQATVRDVRAVSSTLSDRGLHDCILSKVHAHTWRAAGIDDHDAVEKTSISVVGLRKIARRLAPPKDEAEEEEDVDNE